MMLMDSVLLSFLSLHFGKIMIMKRHLIFRLASVGSCWRNTHTNTHIACYLHDTITSSIG